MENHYSNDNQTKGFFLPCQNTFVYYQKRDAREYERKIAETALFNNTWISIPRGTGNRFIASIVIQNFARWYPASKTVFLGPTQQALNLQREICLKNGIQEDDIYIKTGRDQIDSSWKYKKIIFAIPNLFLHYFLDLINVTSVKCLIVDNINENDVYYMNCLRIVEAFHGSNSIFRVVVLSYGNNGCRVAQQLVNDFDISEIEQRNDTSEDFSQYVLPWSVSTIKLQTSPSVLKLKEEFYKIFESYLRRLKNARVLSGNVCTLTKFQLMKFKSQFLKSTMQLSDILKKDLLLDFEISIGLSAVLSEFSKRELKETYNSLDKLRQDCKIAGKLCQDTGLLCFMHKLTDIINNPEHNDHHHPKFMKLREIIEEHLKNQSATSKDKKIVILCSKQEYDTFPLEVFKKIVPKNNIIKSSSKTMNKYLSSGPMKIVITSSASSIYETKNIDLIVSLNDFASFYQFIDRVKYSGSEGGTGILIIEEDDEVKYKNYLLNRKSSVVNIPPCVMSNNSPRMIPEGVTPRIRFLNQLGHMEKTKKMTYGNISVKLKKGKPRKSVPDLDLTKNTIFSAATTSTVSKNITIDNNDKNGFECSPASEIECDTNTGASTQCEYMGTSGDKFEIQEEHNLENGEATGATTSTQYKHADTMGFQQEKQNKQEESFNLELQIFKQILDSYDSKGKNEKYTNRSIQEKIRDIQREFIHNLKRFRMTVDNEVHPSYVSRDTKNDINTNPVKYTFGNLTGTNFRPKDSACEKTFCDTKRDYNKYLLGADVPFFINDSTDTIASTANFGTVQNQEYNPCSNDWKQIFDILSESHGNLDLNSFNTIVNIHSECKLNVQIGNTVLGIRNDEHSVENSCNNPLWDSEISDTDFLELDLTFIDNTLDSNNSDNKENENKSISGECDVPNVTNTIENVIGDELIDTQRNENVTVEDESVISTSHSASNNIGVQTLNDIIIIEDQHNESIDKLQNKNIAVKDRTVTAVDYNENQNSLTVSNCEYFQSNSFMNTIEEKSQHSPISYVVDVSFRKNVGNCETLSLKENIKMHQQRAVDGKSSEITPDKDSRMLVQDLLHLEAEVSTVVSDDEGSVCSEHSSLIDDNPMSEEDVLPLHLQSTRSTPPRVKKLREKRFPRKLNMDVNSIIEDVEESYQYDSFVVPNDVIEYESQDDTECEINSSDSETDTEQVGVYGNKNVSNHDVSDVNCKNWKRGRSKSGKMSESLSECSSSPSHSKHRKLWHESQTP